MEHFYQNIHGWPNDLPKVYAEVVRHATPTGAHFVEVGCWKGASSAAMCVEIINSGKEIKFDCVDTWKGSDEHYAGGLAEDQDVINDRLFEVFTENMKPVKDYYRAVRLTSLEAAATYADNSLDLVCIDAAHDYENVKNDILAWVPKIKSGGLLVGDDYPWPGVAQAVNECCPGAQCQLAWWWIKP